MRLAVLLLAVSAFGQDLNSISRTASGNITGANSSCLGYNCVWIVPPPNANAITVQITGTFSGTVVFEATTTGASYSSVAATNGDTSATATGTWNFPLYGYRAFRVRGSAYVSGPVVVSIGAASATTAGTGGWTDDGSTITAAAGRNVSIGGKVSATAGTSTPGLAILPSGTPVLQDDQYMATIDRGSLQFNGLAILGAGGDLGHKGLAIQNRQTGDAGAYWDNSGNYYTSASINMSAVHKAGFPTGTINSEVEPISQVAMEGAACLTIRADTFNGSVFAAGAVANSRSLVLMDSDYHFLHVFDRDGGMRWGTTSTTTSASMDLRLARVAANTLGVGTSAAAPTAGLMQLLRIGIGAAPGSAGLAINAVGNAYLSDNTGTAEGLTFDVRGVYRTDGPSINADSGQVLYLQSNGTGRQVGIGGPTDFPAMLAIRQNGTADYFTVEDAAGGDSTHRPFAVKNGGAIQIGANDTSYSRVAPGVIAFGTGAAGSKAGRIALDNSTPSAASDACTAQSIWADANYVYVCTASGAIKRAAVASW